MLFSLNEKVAPNFSESRLRYDCIIRCAGFTEEGEGGGLEITCPGINHTNTSAKSEGYEVRQFAINRSCPAHTEHMYVFRRCLFVYQFLASVTRNVQACVTKPNTRSRINAHRVNFSVGRCN